jgi:hypothetical protein
VISALPIFYIAFVTYPVEAATDSTTEATSFKFFWGIEDPFVD